MAWQTIEPGRARPKNKLYKINKDIPIPRQGINGNGKWQSIIVNMQIGDSMLVRNQSEARGATRAIQQLHNKHTKVRKEGDEYRVWMVEVES